MGWSIGYDPTWDRDVGYGVPAICDHEGCNEEIHRGLSHVCGGEPYGGEKGCGLFFCGAHLFYSKNGEQLCEKCLNREEPFDPKPDVKKWIKHKLTHASWEDWRKENPEFIKKYKENN